MKKVSALALLASSMLLASCGGANSCPTVDSGKASEEAPAAKAATLVHSFITPAKLVYRNMRPTYNYYMTTFTFETLDLYNDNSYVLSVSSSMFTAIELPQEGQAAKGNENANSLLRYHGTYTSEADDLDPDALVLSLSATTRITGTDDGKGEIDTDLWTDSMKKKWADVEVEYNTETGAQTEVGRTEYESGAKFLEVHGANAVDGIIGSTVTGILDWVELTFGE